MAYRCLAEHTKQLGMLSNRLLLLYNLILTKLEFWKELLKYAVEGGILNRF